MQAQIDTSSPTPGATLIQGFSIKEVADQLGKSYITIYRAVNKGHLKTHRIGRDHVITAEQVNDWLGRGGKTS